MEVGTELSRDLNRLTARIDLAGDRLLADEYGLSYRHFVTLLLVGQLTAPMQRALAEAMGVSEPSISRMTKVLRHAGLLDASTTGLSGGNRRQLGLTPAGKDVVEQCRGVLELRLVDLAARSRVPYAVYLRQTRQLLQACFPASEVAQ